MLTGFWIVTLCFLVWLRFDAGAIWHDLSIAAGAKSGGLSLALVKNEITKNVIPIALLAALSGLLSLSGTPVRFPLIGAALAGSSLALSLTNYQTGGMPLAGVLP